MSTNDNNGNPNVARCLQVWNGIMQNPPSASDSGANEDYAVDAAAGVCSFFYCPNVTTCGSGTSTMSITYDSTNGAVTVDSTL